MLHGDAEHQQDILSTDTAFVLHEKIMYFATLLTHFSPVLRFMKKPVI